MDKTSSSFRWSSTSNTKLNKCPNILEELARSHQLTTPQHIRSQLLCRRAVKLRITHQSCITQTALRTAQSLGTTTKRLCHHLISSLLRSTILTKNHPNPTATLPPRTQQGQVRSRKRTTASKALPATITGALIIGSLSFLSK